MIKLLQTTNAYKVIASDKAQGNLSHAYLVECADKDAMRGYLKQLARLILCPNGGDDDCRVCRLLEKETHSDIEVLPRAGEKLKAQTADEIVSSCIIKPLEIEKKMFIISGFDAFEKSQNKLLKTLEEPPQNVILLLGTNNMNDILPTVKSRTKKVEIPAFSDELLFEAFKDIFTDEAKLKTAIALSQGLESKLRFNYEGDDNEKIKELALDILISLNTSKDVLSQSLRLNGVDFKLFLSVVKVIFGELLRLKSGSISRLLADNRCKVLEGKFKMGAVLEIIEGISNIERSIHFNANQTMVIDRLFFLVLEAKHRWQKL